MSATQLLDYCSAAGVKVYLSKASVKVRGNSEAVRRMMPLLRSRKAEVHAYLCQATSLPDGTDQERLFLQLEPFMLDTVTDDPDRDEVNRVNNMTWEFMQVDGMEFSDAIRLAAEIVVSCEVAVCEAAYTDVMALWERLREGRG